MFGDLIFKEEEALYPQLVKYIEKNIEEGSLPKGSKLPSSRELGNILNVSRNTVIQAYENLCENGYLETLKGKGTFVSMEAKKKKNLWKPSFSHEINSYGKLAKDLDIVNTEKKWEKGMISFKTISPLGSLFDIEEFKKAFNSRISLEGDKILNYGYARGYKPLINYLQEYMKEKGIVNSSKEILITNGFTEAFDLILSTFTEEGDNIICENPTHNTAIKIMKTHGLNILGVRMTEEGIDIKELKYVLDQNKVKLAFLIPSYHNPTGVVTPLGKRKEIYSVLKEYNVPIIEDGFNEELFYESSHIASLAALEGEGLGVIYIGSFSKVLFPGLRIGWIYGEKELIETLESVKRCRNIHSSFLDQAILFDYLNSGAFKKYIKKIRRTYKEKFEFTLMQVNKYIKNYKLWGEGGLYLYLTIEGIDTRKLLDNCYTRGVLFMCSDIFDVYGEDKSAIRIGFTRVKEEEIEEGIRIIGEEVNKLKLS